MKKNDIYNDIKILIVEDDEDSRWIAVHALRKGLGFNNIIEVENGEDALNYIRNHNDVDIIFLDRMMPKMTGIELCKELNKNPKLKDIIVIFQTGKTQRSELEDVLEVECHYLVKKPYMEEDITAFFYSLASKVRLRKQFKDAMKNIKYTGHTYFEVKNLTQAAIAAIELSSHYPEPNTMVEPIYELIINGIEHGNLGIGGLRKAMLLRNNHYDKYISEQLIKPEHKNKSVAVNLEKNNVSILLSITDEGKGFDSLPYMEYTAEKILEPVGRGISRACMEFHDIEYNDEGNSVTCTMYLRDE